MTVTWQTPQIQLALQELDRQLREAFLYARRYNKGWERVVELQALYEHYQEAVQQSQRLQPDRALRKAA